LADLASINRPFVIPGFDDRAGFEDNPGDRIGGVEWRLFL
jgi:hypothetical protein